MIFSWISPCFSPVATVCHGRPRMPSRWQWKISPRSWTSSPRRRGRAERICWNMKEKHIENRWCNAVIIYIYTVYDIYIYSHIFTSVHYDWKTMNLMVISSFLWCSDVMTEYEARRCDFLVLHPSTWPFLWFSMFHQAFAPMAGTLMEWSPCVLHNVCIIYIYILCIIYIYIHVCACFIIYIYM